MTPLTLQILAGMLQAHGPDATVASDHKGIDFLLTGVREGLRDQGTEFDISQYELANYLKAIVEPGFKYHLYFKYEKYDKMEPSIRRSGQPTDMPRGGDHRKQR